MLSFRTEFNYDIEHPPFSRDDKVVLAGSCFAEYFGDRLKVFEFNTLSNPFGVIFNPLSLFSIVRRALNGRVFTSEELFFNDGLWRVYDAHSAAAGSDREKTLRELNMRLQEFKNELETARYLFFTFGTAWTYRIKPDGKPAANCHKMPAEAFVKALAELDEMQAGFEQMIRELKRVNPELNIVLTVSPVRHLRDGFTENNRSKARLIELSHMCAESFKGVKYWPAYELIIDDLRDYRFYNEDMVHPSKQAVDYVWEKFEKSFFDSRTRAINRKVLPVLLSISRKAPERPHQRQKMKEALITKISRVEKEYNISLNKMRAAVFDHLKN